VLFRSASRLRTQARFFARRGYCAVLPGNPGFGDPQTVSFSFDDAFESCVKLSSVELESVGFRGTYYAVTGKVGGKSDWEGGDERPLATFSDLREVAGRGHTVGNHSVSHPFLAKLDTESQRVEIEGAQKALIAEGLEPRSFCFPYGSHDSRTLDILAGAGYEYALSLRKLGRDRMINPLVLPRVVVAFGDTLPLLLYKCFVRPKLRRKVRNEHGGV